MLAMHYFLPQHATIISLWLVMLQQGFLAKYSLVVLTLLIVCKKKKETNKQNKQKKRLCGLALLYTLDVFTLILHCNLTQYIMKVWHS